MRLEEMRLVVGRSKLQWCALAAAALLAGCASTPGGNEITTSFKAPDAKPMVVSGARVAAVAMVKDPQLRQTAEDQLVKELNARGAQGIAMYKLFPSIDPSQEQAAKKALESAGVQGIVVMLPKGKSEKVTNTPITYDPEYTGYWGRFYQDGWSNSYSAEMVPGTTRTDTQVGVETRVYSLPQNKLVWAGESRTTNPANVNSLISEVATAVGRQLQREGLVDQAYRPKAE
jgi:hypothetical protein